jgi:hypothetical protein
MAKLANGVAASPTTGTAAANGAAPDVGDLAVEMRGAVTPVIGYLELMSEEGHTVPPDQHLRWIATIERRLATMQELNDQIARICGVLRDSVNDREAATRRAPEAPEG